MKNNSNVSNCLFICYTPLHALIAKKVIELEKIKSYILIFYYKEDTSKIKHYYNSLSNNASESFYVNKNNKVLSTIQIFFMLYLKLKKYRHSNLIIYTGNLKTIYTRFILFVLNAQVLKTFDDGIGNVCGEGYFYEGISPKFYDKFLSNIGLNFTYRKWYKLIKKHYTIYKTQNVMPFAHYIDLFSFKLMEKKTSNNASKTTVLLTSTLTEDGFTTLDIEKKLYKHIIDKFEVKYSILHPLESFNKLDNLNLKIIKSDKIAEDVIMDLKKVYDDIIVIGWYSSALIHLSNIKGIQVINIDYNIDNMNLEKTKLFFDSYQVLNYVPQID